MRCFRPLLALVLLALCAALPARAHKSSDAYLQVAPAQSGIELRVDVALRDLDVVLDLDGDGDGRLTWGEVKAAWPAIEGYVVPRVGVDGCALAPAGVPALERRSDGAYAVLRLAAPCALPAAPRLRYALFAEVDPTHRGIASVQGVDGRKSAVLLDPQAPGAAVAHGAAPPETASFLAEGVHHIVTGYDHLLFLLCLILPAVMRRDGRRWRPVTSLRDALLPVLGIVTAFTVAHSITLALAAMQWVWLPASIVEPAIAATIVIAALDNLVPIFGRLQRWTVAFGFGLIHGFGFAGVLAELDLPAGEFAWALLRFNVGLELGQVAVVAVAVALLYALRGHRAYPRLAIGAGSLAAIAVGVLWFVERTADVSLLPI
jgi:hypothetical protein